MINRRHDEVKTLQFGVNRVKRLPRVNTFSQRTVNDWNALPKHVVEAPSINSFKNMLDEHWDQRKYMILYSH